MEVEVDGDFKRSNIKLMEAENSRITSEVWFGWLANWLANWLAGWLRCIFELALRFIRNGERPFIHTILDTRYLILDTYSNSRIT